MTPTKYQQDIEESRIRLLEKHTSLLIRKLIEESAAELQKNAASFEKIKQQ